MAYLFPNCDLATIATMPRVRKTRIVWSCHITTTITEQNMIQQPRSVYYLHMHVYKNSHNGTIASQHTVYSMRMCSKYECVSVPSKGLPFCHSSCNALLLSRFACRSWHRLQLSPHSLQWHQSVHPMYNADYIHSINTEQNLHMYNAHTHTHAHIIIIHK